MSKILKNTTVSDISINSMGLTINASSQLTINTEDYMLLAAEDAITELTPLINSGDIVVNDGIDDITVANGFSLARAIDFLEYPDYAFNLRFEAEPERSNGFSSKNIQEAIEESRNSGIGTVLEFHFSSGTNNTGNAWLTFHDPSSPSNEVPAVIPQQVEVKGVTFSNKDDDSHTDIQVFKNGVLAFTVEVRNKRYYWKVGATLATFNQSDRMSVYLKKFGAINNAPSKPQISIYCKIVNEAPLIGGEQYGD